MLKQSQEIKAVRFYNLPEIRKLEIDSRTSKGYVRHSP